MKDKEKCNDEEGSYGNKKKKKSEEIYSFYSQYAIHNNIIVCHGRNE